jgi:GntR family transcriptional regulator / MocR family aminotransferase
MPKETAEINPAGIRLSKKSTTPLYRQVYEQFREMILSKRLRPGERLPASRNLAKELGVSRVIISQGYEQLMMEGYITGKTGAGTFVATTLPDSLLNAKQPAGQASKVTVAPPLLEEPGDRVEIIPFQGGTPSLDLFPYKAWQQVGNKVLKALKSYHLGYDDTLGHWPLRTAIADYLRVSRAVKCEASQVIIVTGSQQGLNLVVETLLARGDKVWMEDPGYPGALSAFQAMEAEICPIPVEEDGMDIDYAMKHYPNAKLAYLTPSHQSPLGRVLSQEKRRQLLKMATKHSIWILEDDYDSEFRYEGRPLASLQGLDTGGRVIYSGTFSKVLFPGLRLAYIVLPTLELVDQFKRIKNNLDRQSPIMDQLILAKFMEEGYFLRHIRKMRLLYAERQKILIRLLQEYLPGDLTPYAAPSGMHLLCYLSKKINVDILRREAAQHRLVISFVDTLKHAVQPAIVLGYTAFSKYKLKMGVERLKECVERAKLIG